VEVKLKSLIIKSLYRIFIKTDAKKVTIPEPLDAELKRIYSIELKEFENIL
jgi:hypothetical protein